jgi:hypothetical protein
MKKNFFSTDCIHGFRMILSLSASVFLNMIGLKVLLMEKIQVLYAVRTAFLSNIYVT